jgi:hypothetical protein
MHSRPNAAELIEAVREHLSGEVLSLLEDPRVRFQTRVAIFVLSIVERELVRGDWPTREALARLHGLGIPSPDPGTALEDAWEEAEKALCGRIQAGEADHGGYREEVLHHIRETLRERLRVASPDFPIS